MSIWEIVLLAVALAMDCFTVSVVSGVLLRRFRAGTALREAFLFGFFQGLMPMAGWLAVRSFSSSFEAVDHWIAFGLLAFIGGKMIVDAFRPEEEKSFNPERLRTQLAMAVATSIDALAVGITFACTGYTAFGQLLMPVLVIGLVSFTFSVAGFWLGVRFGDAVARRFKPDLVGGIILIGIGLKVLLEHLTA
jgi:putative Mn2+ efflux pump MntP